ncbi:hypothetical protein WR25_25806 [Diploscapter pachys]|uniref:G-protein coupled receptors family 2 profile 2 domain-containing protein n=1 Tax=Diploscapter pachys TaxID=2018661 RepID=A0A2A2LVV2_9BILA|nr:hypothetical protein WR25_25806 [Diploscapter pachys]
MRGANFSSWITPLTALNLTPPLPDHFLEITTECCAAAKRCCENTLSPARKPTTKSQIQKVLGIQPQGGCEATWDGWQCFEAASANTNVTKECPVYIYGDYIKIPEFDNFALKRCGENGWSKQQDREYTDYSRCSPSKVEEVELKLIVGIVAYSISVVFLLPAVFLLFSLRRIREQPMFTLHRHLLISFLFYGILYLVNVLIFIVEDAPLSIFVFTNNIFCRLLFTIQLRFLRLSNFSWMLAEGIYLYRLLLSTQTSEGEDLTVYVVLCWGIPALLAGFYSLVRWLYDSGGMCWVENSHLLWVEWSIIVPSLLAILVNVLLLMFIMYILVKKLRCNPHLERIQYRKAVRAAFMLMPVFGLQQLFTIVRLSNTFYQVLDISLNGLQGFFVSLIICYTNKTVLESVSKWWTSHRVREKFTDR